MKHATAPFSTADLYDTNESEPTLRVLPTQFKNYGTLNHFHGPVATIACYEDNSLVKKSLEEAGKGRILVVDGKASYNVALVGDILATLAIKNGWNGIVVNGSIRDSVIINTMPVGIKALGTNPKKSLKQGKGQCEVAVSIDGIIVKPGDHLYADNDGIIIAERPLL